jgi:hypothetical protein
LNVTEESHCFHFYVDAETVMKMEEPTLNLKEADTRMMAYCATLESPSTVV